jgi:hypothetical protein
MAGRVRGDQLGRDLPAEVSHRPQLRVDMSDRSSRVHPRRKRPLSSRVPFKNPVRLSPTTMLERMIPPVQLTTGAARRAMSIRNPGGQGTHPGPSLGGATHTDAQAHLALSLPRNPFPNGTTLVCPGETRVDLGCVFLLSTYRDPLSF